MSAKHSVGTLPSNPRITNVTMTNADTEYYHQLRPYTKKFMIHTRDESSFRLAFITGYVAASVEPHLTIPAGSRGYEDDVNIFVANTDWDGTLYFASSDIGKVIEIVEWI